MSALKRPLALVLSAALLVVGFDVVTYAATGDSLILGKSNVTNKATKLKRTTGGPVLDLKAKKNSPPLRVNSSVRVDNLNADMVDGLSSAELAGFSSQMVWSSGMSPRSTARFITRTTMAQ